MLLCGTRFKKTAFNYSCNAVLDPLRRSSIKIGTAQRRLAWHLRKDDTHKSRSVCITFSPAVYAQFNSTLDGMPLLFVASKQGLKIVCDDHFWVPCHFSFRSAVDHAVLCSSMKMGVPGLADSLQQYLCGNSGI